METILPEEKSLTAIGRLPFISEAFSSILDFIYPPECPVCHNLIEDEPYPVCSVCLGRMKPLEENEQMRLDVPDIHSLHLNTVGTLYRYNEPVRSIIHQFKYSGKKILCEPLGKKLALFIRRSIPDHYFNEKSVLVPVPLNHLKFIMRGYNQSALLAREVGRRLDIPLVEDILVRRRFTRTQTALDHKTRRMNIQEAFCLSKNDVFTDTHVIIIDDVITTGSTVTECARVISEDGCRAISIFGIASPGK